MNKRTRYIWLSLVVGFVWGTLIAVLWFSKCEPLTGISTGFWCGLNIFHALIAFLATLLIFHRWYILGTLFVALILLLAFPLPSKSGVKIQVINAAGVKASLTVTRTDMALRRVEIAVPPGQSVTYTSSSGDYPESRKLTIKYGNRRLETTIGELRKYQILVSDTDIQLVELKKE